MAKKTALRAINNSTAYQIVNSAYKQAVGDAAVDTIDLKDFCDTGVAFTSLTMNRDTFFKALIDQVISFYNDDSYEDEYVNPYFTDAARFRAIVQMINASAPEVQESHAWRDLTPQVDGGGNITYATVGSYPVKMATVQTDYYTKQVAWELPFAISEERLTTAFKNEEELRGMVDYLFVVVQNKLLAHKEQLWEQNRNNLIGAKIHHATIHTPGIHVVNLFKKYNAERGGTLVTVQDFLESPEALRFASAQMVLYSEYMRKQTALFNTKGLVKFCPRDRMVCEINSAFESAMLEVALSSTFHDQLVEMPNHYSTPAWQGFGVTDAIAGTEAAAFDQVTKIDVTLDLKNDQSQNITVTQSGIVGLIADQHCAVNSIIQDRVASQYFPMEDCTLYAYQHKDMYITNLAQNAVVFVLDATNVPPVSAIGLGTMDELTKPVTRF